MSRLAEIVADPAWLPHRLDPAGDRVQFMRIPREVRRRRPFLYNAEPASPDDACWIEGAAVRAAGPSGGQCHFVFHTAFCRSTLLVQSLDVEGIATGLSEPAVVQDLADLRDSDFGRAMLRPVIDLLARPMRAGEVVIVKPSNAANALLPNLLADRPDAKAVLMTSGLAEFLRSVAKKGLRGRLWARRLFARVDGYAPIGLALDGTARYELTDMQAAGLAWLGQQRQLAWVADRDTACRVASLDGDAFNAHRPATFAALGEFFGLPIDDQRAVELAQAPIFQSHSKQGGDFAEIAAREEAAVSGAMIDQEIELVAAWVMHLAGQLQGPPVPLGRPLIEV
ncbi:hypothetical protein A6F68_01330 [Tsuneonella dongtanensis]|uniref:Uncharacterized protein n=1 Tax=Tsuneonella dongtanensis TaxID=692370 RepID=A0A1B2ACI1_9SPHN|nr:hypothetical protein [Tsuneonella dongtanensis]ANY19847.1 hypothetical protein A6F68_01330 [Tsuneonella dongtanensis]